MDEAILSGLHGMRMAPIVVTDIIAALALGLLIAGILGIAASMFRRTPKTQTLAERIALARALPQQQRTLALAGMLKDMTDRVAAGAAPWPDRAGRAFDLDAESVNLLKQLYRPGISPNPDSIERAVLTASRR